MSRSPLARIPARGRRAIVGGIILGAVVAWGWVRHPDALEHLHRTIAGLDAGLVVLALVVLPLVGVPVSVMHAVTGARFGLAVGFFLVAGSILVQLAMSRVLVRVAARWCSRRIESVRRRLPPAAHPTLALFVLLLPGAPFWAQNYTLAIAGVPRRIYYGYSLPFHVARSVIGVVFGGWSSHLTPLRCTVIALYAAGVIVACSLAFRRLRCRLRDQPPAEDGPTRCG